MASRRAEFPKAVALKAAQRAAYRCSFPGCVRVTTGPGGSDTETSTTGKAAHIYSASEGGPRGTGGLSFKERQAIGNAIWLCSEHADRIDKNNGAEFPATTLILYKQLHEERIRCERGEIRLRRGWIHSLSIERAPVFRTPTKIRFGKVTVLQGDNGAGKTAICDWLQGMSDPSVLSRWVDAKRSRTLSFQVSYLDPLPQTLRVRMHGEDAVEYFVNDEPVPFDPNPIRFVRLKDLRYHRFTEQIPEMRDLAFLSETFSTTPPLIRNMLPLVGIHSLSTVRALRIVPDAGCGESIWTDVDGTLPGLSLQGQLSGSERSRVLIEIAAAFARHSAKRVPTMLLLDWAAKSFVPSLLGEIIDFLASDANPFQTVIEIVDQHFKGHPSASLVKLVGNTSDVAIGPHGED